MLTLKQKLDSSYTIDPDTGCWVVHKYLRYASGAVRQPDGQGYLRMPHRGKKVSMHRTAYEVYVGPIPEGMEVDHTCRNKLCINPDHLEPTTHGDNIRRRVFE